MQSTFSSGVESKAVTFFAVLGVFVGVSLCAAADDPGQQAFLKEKCDRCHAIASLGIEARDKEEEAPDLSNAGDSLPSADWVVKWVMREETKDGKKHQKPYEGSKKNLGRISDWLVTLKTS
jgi:hypothetical protein